MSKAMDCVRGFVDAKVMPLTMRLVQTTFIQVLKDGMIYIMPALITGSFFLLVSSLPFTGYSDFLAEHGIDVVLNQAYNATYNIMALIAVLGIAYTYVNKKGYDGFPAAVIGFCAFLVLLNFSATDEDTGVVVSGVLSTDWTSAKGMLCAIIVGFYTGILYTWFLRRDIRIKMPDTVPPNISNSFSALIPGAAIICGAVVVYAVFNAFGTTMVEALYTVIQTPLQGLTDSLGGVIVISLAMPFLWFFGIHGTSIVNSIIVPFLRANLVDNQAILDAGMELTVANGAHIVTEQFYDTILMMSGTGIVFGITIYLVFFAKSKQCRELGKLAAIPNLFNINEPILFGLPVVFNPIMALPFFLVPLVAALMTYFAIYFGIVPPYSGTVVPWTVPPVISGFILGGWRTALLQVVILVMSFLVYLPFVHKVDMMNLAQEQGESEQIAAGGQAEAAAAEAPGAAPDAGEAAVATAAGVGDADGSPAARDA